MVLNVFFITLSKSILLANSFIRNIPVSEDKSPPSKFILILLLHSKRVSTKLDIEGSPLFCFYFQLYSNKVGPLFLWIYLHFLSEM